MSDQETPAEETELSTSSNEDTKWTKPDLQVNAPYLMGTVTVDLRPPTPNSTTPASPNSRSSASLETPETSMRSVDDPQEGFADTGPPPVYPTCLRPPALKSNKAPSDDGEPGSPDSESPSNPRREKLTVHFLQEDLERPPSRILTHANINEGKTRPGVVMKPNVTPVLQVGPRSPNHAGLPRLRSPLTGRSKLAARRLSKQDNAESPSDSVPTPLNMESPLKSEDSASSLSCLSSPQNTRSSPVRTLSPSHTVLHRIRSPTIRRSLTAERAFSTDSDTGPSDAQPDAMQTGDAAPSQDCPSSSSTPADQPRPQSESTQPQAGCPPDGPAPLGDPPPYQPPPGLIGDAPRSPTTDEPSGGGRAQEGAAVLRCTEEEQVQREVLATAQQEAWAAAVPELPVPLAHQRQHTEITDEEATGRRLITWLWQHELETLCRRWALLMEEQKDRAAIIVELTEGWGDMDSWYARAATALYFVSQLGLEDRRGPGANKPPHERSDRTVSPGESDSSSLGNSCCERRRDSESLTPRIDAFGPIALPPYRPRDAVRRDSKPP